MVCWKRFSRRRRIKVTSVANRLQVAQPRHSTGAASCLLDGASTASPRRLNLPPTGRTAHIGGRDGSYECRESVSGRATRASSQRVRRDPAAIMIDAARTVADVAGPRGVNQKSRGNRIRQERVGRGRREEQDLHIGDGIVDEGVHSARRRGWISARKTEGPNVRLACRDGGVALDLQHLVRATRAGSAWARPRRSPPGESGHQGPRNSR